MVWSSRHQLRAVVSTSVPPTTCAPHVSPQPHRVVANKAGERHLRRQRLCRACAQQPRRQGGRGGDGGGGLLGELRRLSGAERGGVRPRFPSLWRQEHLPRAPILGKLLQQVG